MTAPARQIDIFTKRARKVAAPEPSELQVQIALVERLRYCAAPDVLWAAIPNGEHRDKRTGAKLKAMGVRAGAADMLFVYRGHVLFLELKRRGGKPSTAQIEFAADARRAGAEYIVCDSLDEAVSLLTDKGILLPTRAA